METNSPLFTNYLDLAAEKMGGRALICSDDFFAEKENLLKPGRGIFIHDKYTDRGKWMDGWESRRKRVSGYDWCIIKLGVSGVLKGFDIDTNHFMGNHPPFASVDGCTIFENILPNDLVERKEIWTEILPKSPLNPGSQHFFELNNNTVFTHLRLNIYPDGGVARFKVYGEPYKNWSDIAPGELIDLAAAVNGAKSILCNDMFFSHMDNLIMPNRGYNMGDGWETKRNRTPNNKDWVIIRLAHKGSIDKILVDTCHFKGNFPDSCSLEGCLIEKKDEGSLSHDSNIWVPLLEKQKLMADAEHLFSKEIKQKGPFSHVKLTIYPDGGISRLRLWGKIV